MTRYERQETEAALAAGEQIVYERLPTENATDYHYFSCFRDLGPKRTLDLVASALKGSVARGHLQWLCVEHRWKERAEAWDAHLDRLRRDVVEGVTVEQIRDWATERERIRDLTLTAGYEALDLGRQMITKALVQLQDEKEKVRVSQIALLLKAANDLLRDAAELSTERIDVRELVRQAARDAGLDPEAVLAEADLIMKGGK